VHAEQSIKSDVQRVSTISTVALLVLFFALFRTLRSLAFVAFTPLFSVLVATAATLLAFGELHGATLAFGATLVGVCVDFPVHLLGHHTLGTHGNDAHRTLASIWPAIRLGGLTTLAGLFGLSLASFPGIREMTFFTAVGVLASLALTRYALPHVLGPGGRATGTQRAIAAWLAHKVAALRARPALSALLLVAALALCIAGVPGMRFQDDLANWVPAPAKLRAEDERVRARVIGTEPGRLVVTTGADDEAALAANDALAVTLGEAQRAGEISGFRSLHALLFSGALQQRNLTALAQAPDLRARFAPALDAAGFTPEAFAPFFDDLTHPAPALRLPELLASPLAPVASALAIEVDGRPALLTHLRGVRDPQALERRIAKVPNARYFDQGEFLRTTYARFRARTLELLGAGLVLVFLLILARYRALRPTLAALLPAVLAACGALSALSLLSVKIDLFHVIGVLLVLSMGEDYGVFLVESEDQQSLPATLLGLLLACASTVLSFGLLAMSAIPALRSLGQVISIGMLLALVWAPAGLVLLRPAGRGA
jgi:predicted exporter